MLFLAWSPSFTTSCKFRASFLNHRPETHFQSGRNLLLSRKPKRENFVLHKRGQRPGICQKVGAAHYVGWEYGPQVVRWCLARCHSLTSPACCLSLHHTCACTYLHCSDTYSLSLLHFICTCVGSSAHLLCRFTALSANLASFAPWLCAMSLAFTFALCTGLTIFSLHCNCNFLQTAPRPICTSSLEQHNFSAQVRNNN